MSTEKIIADGELLQIRCPQCGRVLFDSFKDYKSKVRQKCPECETFWEIEIDATKGVVFNPSPPKVSKGCYISSSTYLRMAAATK